MVEIYNLFKDRLSKALERARRKRTFRSKEGKLPTPPKQYGAKEIKALRKKLRCSQKVFAIFLNVSLKTIQAWESGERHPNSITNRLLEILDSKRKRNKFFFAITG